MSFRLNFGMPPLYTYDYGTAYVVYDLCSARAQALDDEAELLERQAARLKHRLGASKWVSFSFLWLGMA